ncbi:hypothetical protein V6N12_047276 [Hibiscus sabdariffa]|uniref:Transmembrane protein n=1 Tax=Hibiscus sabdariffa TaxID=183260 RepID=A0ABR2DAE4_9ROSI
MLGAVGSVLLMGGCVGNGQVLIGVAWAVMEARFREWVFDEWRWVDGWKRSYKGMGAERGALLLDGGCWRLGWVIVRRLR